MTQETFDTNYDRAMRLRGTRSFRRAAKRAVNSLIRGSRVMHGISFSVKQVRTYHRFIGRMIRRSYP